MCSNSGPSLADVEFWLILTLFTPTISRCFGNRRPKEKFEALANAENIFNFLTWPQCQVSIFCVRAIQYDKVSFIFLYKLTIRFPRKFILKMLEVDTGLVQ